MRIPTAVIRCLALGVVAGLAGCQCLPACCHRWLQKESRGAEVPVPATVDVGGLVVRPGALAIPTDGLTLRRALALAGQVPSSSSAIAAASTSNVSLQKLDEYIEVRKRKLVVNQMKEFPQLFPNANVAELNREFLDLTGKAEAFQTSIGSTLLAGAFTKLGDLAASGELHRFLEKLLVDQPGARQVLDPTGTTLNALLAELKTEGDQFPIEYAATKGNLSSSSPSSIVTVADLQLVSLSRKSGGTSTTYYMPYDLAVATTAGEVVLAAGDLVQVIPFRQTQLDDQGGAGQFRIQGLVLNGGGLRTLTGSGKLGDALNADAPSVNAQDLVAAVERNVTSANREVFIIPRGLAVGGSMSTFALQPGDICTVTVLNRVPIVTHGLVVNALRAGGGRAPNNQIINAPKSCAPALCAPVREHLRQHREKCGVESGPALRTATEAYETLRYRTRGITPAAPQTVSP